MAFPLIPTALQRHLIPLLKQRAAAAPGLPLLTQDGTSLSAEDLLRRGDAFARALSGAGLQAGDRVALQCGNRPEFLVVLIGCALAGMVLVPINTASRGNQLAYYVRNSGARVFVTEPPLFEHLENARSLDPDAIDAIEVIWSLDDCAQPQGLPRLACLAGARLVPEAPVQPILPATTAIVMYTSGTSGPSKGVLCSHAQLYWWGHHSLKNIGIRPDDVLHTCLPLFHVNALNTFYQTVLSGGRMVLGAKFSVTRFYQDLARTGATVTYLLGAMVPMLLSRQPDGSERDHRVRVALAPGALAQHYQAFESRSGIQMLDGFGSTESNFAICTPIDDRRPGWMGRVVQGFQARVVDEFDNEVPHGTPGELLLRNDEPFAFSSGYFGMPDKTAEAWRNLWFHTGDRVLRDESGYFRFLDRIKDSIRRRGENISSYEVEQALGSHPAVAEVTAYAVHSELAEDEVMCAIVLREGTPYEPLALVQWCEQRLPHFAVPRFLRVVDDMPKTENGKVQKYKLRAEGRTSDTWDRSASGYLVKR